MSPSKPQVKVACLACRSYKTRCDGQHPCANCSSNHRECHYRPSRRGGARRGARYQNARKQLANVVNNLPAHPTSTPAEANEDFVDDLANLIYPLDSGQGNRGFANPNIAENLSPTSRSITQQPNEAVFIRSYHNENDLMNAYYIFIHPYLPLLPPPPLPRYPDNPEKFFLNCLEPPKPSLPVVSNSPFCLALMALLVLLPLSDDPEPMREAQIELRKSYSSLYAREALQRVERFSNDQNHTTAAPVSTPGLDEVMPSSIHPELPSSLEPVLALLLLGVHEYCQNSNRRQMRSRIYSALVLAMDLSLHVDQPTDIENRDVKARVWWTTMFLVYQSAIFNHSSPIVLMNDPRITTPFPKFHGSEALWPKLMRAQEAMLKTGIIAKEMTAGGIKGSPELIRERVCELDSFILTIINELDHSPEIRPPEEVGVDAASILNLWLMARFLTHTARIKLHRFRAFADHPVFLDKFCDLSSINSLISSDLPFAISPGRFSESNSVFPFSEEQSTQICLKAALVLSRTLSALPWPYPSFSDTVGGSKPFSTTGQLSMSSIFSTNRIQYPRSLPYMACCGMQGCYVLMMLLRKIRNALSSNNLAPCRYLLGYTEPATERQDAERFIEELRHGVKSVCDFMLGNAVFGGVMDMAREVETTYIANFHESLAINAYKVE